MTEDIPPLKTLWQQHVASDESADGPPPIEIRWIHLGSSHIALPDAPISAPSTSWEALTPEESRMCEEAWQKLSEEEKDTAVEEEKASEKDHPKEKRDPEIRGVPVGRDGLFEVDVLHMRMSPVFWKLNTPPIPVMRATWMYSTHLPVDEPLAKELEDAYLMIKPWLSSYASELRTSLSLGAEAQQKLRCNLPSGSVVVFQKATMAHLYTGAISRALPTLSSLFATPPGATVVYRGYAAAEKVSVSSGSRSPSKTRSVEEQAQKETTGEGIPAAGGEEKEGSRGVTDLILIIHGIGQGLAEQWEAFNFVYAVNVIRAVARKQATTPALSSVLRSHRVQFLPIQWRASLQLEAEEEEERERTGLDNAFTLDDITIKKTIPVVRDLTNNVLIDVPYFMSHHRVRMIEAVCLQANRAYRLWCERHPDFDRTGRVHIIAHSLGAALAARILSDQPTYVAPLSEYKEDLKDKFIFDTSCLFMLGSPLGVFMHVEQAQLIARKGRDRTMKSPSDEALDKQGVFGCLAVDSIYNIFNPADPVAYLCNPCVDARLSKERQPSAIPNVTSGVMDGVTSSLSRFVDTLPSLPRFSGLRQLDGLPNPFASSSPHPPVPVVESAESSSSESEMPMHKRPTPMRPPTTRFLSSIALANPDAHQKQTGDRGERRFAALNPHSTLDYYLPSAGKVSEYFDMLTAHASYWADPNLSSFILTEISASKEDLIRTGLGPTHQSSEGFAGIPLK